MSHRTPHGSDSNFYPKTGGTPGRSTTPYGPSYYAGGNEQYTSRSYYEDPSSHYRSNYETPSTRAFMDRSSRQFDSKLDYDYHKEPSNRDASSSMAISGWDSEEDASNFPRDPRLRNRVESRSEWENGK